MTDVDVRTENALREAVDSIDHMMTHEPKNKFCAVCNKAKTQRKPRRKGQPDLGPKPLDFGDQLTGDLLIKHKKV